MKKTLLLTLSAAALMTTAEARQWNFTKWGAETQASLLQCSFGVTNSITPDGGWSDVEKSTGTAPTETSKDKCFWSFSTGNVVDGNLCANGTVIAETEGLIFNSGYAGKRNLAIALDYPTALNDYQGGSYLWLGGSKNTCFTIPSVAPGTKITMKVESHKYADTAGRGVQLYLGTSSGTQLKDEDGNAVVVPVEWTEQTWVVPEDATDTPNEDGTYNIAVYNTNGCHIYYINVDEGDGGFDASSTKVAYIFDGTYNGAKDADKNPIGWLANGGLDADPIYTTLQSYDVTPIDLSGITNDVMTTDELNDSLLNFDVVVLGEAFNSGNAYGKAIFNIVNMVPMLNLKSFMYKSGVWSVGAGANPSPKATTIKVNEDYLDHPLFADLGSLDDEGNITLFECEDVTEIPGGNLVQGYTVNAGSLFENDEVLATVGDGIKAIHIHGTKNQYMLIPISSDNMDRAAEDLYMLVYNAITVLAQTKSKVQNAAAPVITQVAGNGITNVSIACTTNDATIYYTVDGTEPTEASPVYAEAFDVTTDGLVVKAFATAHGYNPSAVATAVISVKSKSAEPTITLEGADGQTTITMAQAEGTPIYYSFSGVTDKAQAALYTEPVVVKEPGTIYAFAASDVSLPSDLAIAEFTVGGIPAVKDTIAHFTANQTDWFDNAVLHVNGVDSVLTEAIANASAFGATGNAKAVYYFGKKAWNYYGTEEDHRETVTGSEGQDSIVIYYKPDPAALKTITSNTDSQWIIKSQGQVVTGETSEGPLKGVGNTTAGRYADAAIDEIGGQPSKGFIDFGGKTSGEPYTLRFETTGKYSGDLDVVTYIGNGGTSDIYIALQSSVDGENWQTVDTLNYTKSQRYFKKTRLHLNLTEESYLRVAQIGGGSKGYVYDIYIIRTEGTTGIETIAADRENRQTFLFDLQGRQVAAPVRGHLYIQNGKKFIVK